MKTIETANNVVVAVERNDGDLVKVRFMQGGEHGFLSMGVLLNESQARRLATVIEHTAQTVLREGDGGKA